MVKSVGGLTGVGGTTGNYVIRNVPLHKTYDSLNTLLSNLTYLG
jgi:hypothetical protein